MPQNEIIDLSSSGKRLFYIRRLLKLTRAEFSQKCGLNENTISFWETDRNGGITLPNAEKIVKAIAPHIECSADWLLIGGGEIPTHSSLTFIELPKN
ncbi:MAG: helix-turn-helix transcriptional regulator [Gammaproteobacteria bacterium]|nr:helix-turn-helix transcriptional regulator [Gammaproteobacteria bacterium]